MKAEWIEALRSGDYKQCRHALRNRDNHYCCLGVLCELQGVEWQSNVSHSLGDYFYIAKSLPDDGESKRSWFPDQAFLDEVGISHEFASQLADNNDKGDTFEEIATVIEKGLSTE